MVCPEVRGQLLVIAAWLRECSEEWETVKEQHTLAREHPQIMQRLGV